MGRTPTELELDVESILGCEHGSVTVREVFEEHTLRFEIDQSVVEDSMFDEDQVRHIVDSITPTMTNVSIRTNNETENGNVHCPKCGNAFDPESDRTKLERAVREKIDHTCYDGASYEWVDNSELYIHLPRDGMCTTSVSDREIPDPWSIKAAWCKTEETIVSITREGE